MGDADRAVGGVDRLPAGPGRAIDVDPQVLVVDLDVDILGLGQHRDRRRRGVDAPAAFGHRHALDAVDAAFELQPGEHAGAVDRGDRLLVAAELRRARRDQLEPPALRLGIALVHAQQVAGEQSRLVAAGAGADLEHRRAVVGGVARQQLDRQRALGVGQLVADLLGFGRRHFLELGLGGRVGDHAVQHVELGAQPAHFARRRGDRLDRRIILGQAHEFVGRQVAARHRLLQARASAPRSTRSVPTRFGSLTRERLRDPRRIRCCAASPRRRRFLQLRLRPLSSSTSPMISA